MDIVIIGILIALMAFNTWAYSKTGAVGTRRKRPTT